jgi:penicillin-binding protein 1A
MHLIRDKRRFPWLNRQRVITWGIIAAVVLIIVIAWRTYWVYQEELPSIEEVYNIEPPLKTYIYDQDGTVLQEYYNQNRVMIPYNRIPQQLVDAVVSTEDREFWDHWGFNYKRVIVVAISNILKQRIAAGASTITQQLARQLFLTPEKTISRKIKELLTAIKLERTYSKQEILQLYLNNSYFGMGAYGIASAASRMFNKSVEELSINDCALLIGLLKGPNWYNPQRHPERAVVRRNAVLASMRDDDKLTDEQYDSLSALPLEINVRNEKTGLAPYFTEWVRQYIEGKYGEDELYNGGLKVYTTLDWELQQVAEEAIKAHLDSLQARIEARRKISDPRYSYMTTDTVAIDSLTGENLSIDTSLIINDSLYVDSVRAYKQIQGAAITLDNANGHILAMVGGRDFEESKFNRATQGKRQPGSAFKPFVYTAAIDNGWTPDSILYDNSIVLDIPGTKDWRPHNFDDKYLGRMTLREGLKKSRNMIAIKLLLKIHPELAIFYAQQMGIKSDLAPVPSLAIGTSEVTLEEITSAYTVFPNHGIRIPPQGILKIVDRYGNVLEDNETVPKEEVLREETAYIMVNMMQSVMEPGGTGYGARWRGFTRPAGGKTGTSDDFCDNWFIGYTPQITSGVWVGFDDKTSIGHNMTGSANALPIWTKIMLAAHRDLPVEDFQVPAGIITADICTESGELATNRCPDVVTEVFTSETVPRETCHLHASDSRFTREDRYEVKSDSGKIHF